MKKKILIVEDDQLFREALGDFLRKKFDVSEAANGKNAKEIIESQDFDLVISDIQMPQWTGLDLLSWSIKNKPIPFIIMTGFSLILETNSAFELGAKGFIAKPFKNSELLLTIEAILNEVEKKSPSTEEKKAVFCKVSLDEFVTNKKLEFDVYIKLSETKYVKIVNAGDEIARDKIEFYKTKKIKYLYVLKEDFNKIIGFNLNVIKILKDKDNVAQEKKINFLKYTSEIILEKTFVDGISKESFNEAKEFLNVAIDTISDSSDYLDLLNSLKAHSDKIYVHSFAVSIYAVLIAKKMGFESNAAFFKLSIAGLYHDIGKKELENEIIEKPRHSLSLAERKLLESHVLRGKEIVESMAHMPDDIALLVFEHHEDQAGLGYPMAKKKFEQHPLARILQCANIFVGLILSTEHASQERVDVKNAILYMEKQYGSRVDDKCLEALKALVAT